MEKIFQQLIKFLELPLKIVAFLTILSGVFFFLPSSIRTYLLMTDFYNVFGSFIGPFFVASLLYVLFILFNKLFQYIGRSIKEKKRVKTILLSLEALSIKEIVVLREFFFQGSDVITVVMEDEGVMGLLNKGIIDVVYNPSVRYVFGTIIQVKLNEEVRKHISYELLKLKKDITAKDRQRYELERPAFVNNLQGFQRLQNRIFNKNY